MPFLDINKTGRLRIPEGEAPGLPRIPDDEINTAAREIYSLLRVKFNFKDHTSGTISKKVVKI